MPILPYQKEKEIYHHGTKAEKKVGTNLQNMSSRNAESRAMTSTREFFCIIA
jgi:hypothetical protein